MTTHGENFINIWLPVIISILIGQLQKIFKWKRPKSSRVFGCYVNWPDWNVTIIFRFFQRILKWQPERCFNANGKYVLRLLNIVIHEHQFKRYGKYCKFHFDEEVYSNQKNLIFTFYTGSLHMMSCCLCAKMYFSGPGPSIYSIICM